MNELKNCPFCGKKPEIIQAIGDNRFYVMCKNASCVMIVSTENGSEKEYAIQKWNTRS